MPSQALVFQQACRARLLFLESPRLSNLVVYKLSRPYASKSSLGSLGTVNNGDTHRRKAISVTTDDGRYSWSQLSTSEKAARTTQQSFNFLMVAAGATGTLVVSYLLYQELFAADSKTRQFNHAVDRVVSEPRCREILGPSNKITAYGEPTSNKWARARPLAYSVEVDEFGTTHFRMHFHMEGPLAQGVVNVHMTRKTDEQQLRYRLLSLSVKGQEVVYLENTDAKVVKSAKKMFGVQW